MTPSFNPHGVLTRRLLYTFTGAVLAFLVLPLVVIVPISFTSVSLLVFPLPAFSIRWYEEILSNPIWLRALRNSLIVGMPTTVISTILGTSCAIGLNTKNIRFARVVMGLLLSPMIVPIVITAVGVYFFYAAIGLAGSFTGLILAHTTIALPFVVITVSAALETFDRTLIRAALSLGATPVRTFFKVVLPLIAPGVISGALFAFVTSFDEVVIALFLAGPEQRTLPLQIFSGIRETISPAIASVSVLLTLFAVSLMILTNYLRRRTEQLRTDQVSR